MRRTWIAVVLAVGLLATAGAQAKGSGGGGGSSSSSNVDFSIGVNALQPLVFLMASQFDENEAYILPIPVEIHAHIQKRWGFCGTVQITMYQIGEGDNHQMGEIMAAGGPRYRFTGKKLEGAYATGKFGLSYWGGTAHGVQDYRRLNLVVQPEVGYSVRIGDPGLFLAFGVGVQLGLRLAERFEGDNSPDWNSQGKMLMSYTPWLNVTIGFGG